MASDYLWRSLYYLIDNNFCNKTLVYFYNIILNLFFYSLSFMQVGVGKGGKETHRRGGRLYPSA